MKKVRFISLFSAALFVCATLISSFSVPSLAVTKEGLQDQLNALDAEKAELQAKLDATEAEKNTALENKQYYDTMLQNTSDQLSATGNYIIEVDGKIAESEGKISELDAEIEVKLSEFRENLTVSYQNDRVSMLEIILNSDNFEDFLTNVERSAAILNYRNNLARELNEKLNEQTALKEELKAEKTDREEAQVILQEKQAEYEQQQAKSQEYVDEITQDEDQLKTMLAEKEAAENATRAQLQGIIQAELAKMREEQAAAQTTPAPQTTVPEENPDPNVDPAPVPEPTPTPTPAPTPDTGVTFGWPLAGYSMITCHFGEVDAWGVNAHRGVDIYCPVGTPVLAVAAGKVIAAAPHYSWGNYVVVLHANGMTSLYAHNSSIVVSVGQYVSQGQVISYSGMTGTVTGPHLHLEMTDVYGNLTNPLYYI